MQGWAAGFVAAGSRWESRRRLLSGCWLSREATVLGAAAGGIQPVAAWPLALRDFHVAQDLRRRKDGALQSTLRSMCSAGSIVLAYDIILKVLFFPIFGNKWKKSTT